MSAYEARQAMLRGDMATAIQLLKASVATSPTSTPTTSVVNDTYTPPSSSSSSPSYSSSSASSSSSSSTTGTGNTNAQGGTFQVIYDPSTNKVTTLYPGGARSTSSLRAGETPESAIASRSASLKKSYNNIGGIQTGTQVGVVERFVEEQTAKKARIVANTAAGVGVYKDDTGSGIHSNDLNFLINQGKASNQQEAIQYISDKGSSILKKYYSQEKIDSMTAKQKAAAYELYYQGSTTTQGKRSNGLSIDDLVWIDTKANDFKGAVYSAGGSAISTGVDLYDQSPIKPAYQLGVSRDTRNWESIVASANPKAAAAAATAQMFGGITVKRVSMGYQTDSDGNVLRDDKGKPLLSDPVVALVGNNGAVLGKLDAPANAVVKVLQNYGVRDTSWLNSVSEYLGSDVVSALGSYTDPFANDPTVLDQNYLTGEDPGFFDRFQSAIDYENALKQTQELIEQEQTIKSPEAVPAESVVPGTTNVTTPQPTYTAETTTTPLATASVPTQTPTAVTQTPVTQTPYTPTPTTITGQPVGVGVQPTGVYPQAPVTGTAGTPLQTAGLSAVPQTVQVRDNYTGTNMQNLTSQSQKGFGGQRTYGNQYGQRITVTVDAQGSPLTYVPPGYTPVQGQAEGGDAGSRENEALYTIAKMNGYNGPKSGTALKAFFNSSDALKAKARAVGVAMNKGGAVLYASNGVDVQPGTTTDPTFATQLADQTKDLIGSTMAPYQQPVDKITPEEADFIASTAGQTTAVSPMAEAATVGSVTQAQMPMTADASTYTATTTEDAVKAETDDLQAQTGTVSDAAQVEAQQQLTSSVTGLEAAQGTATMVDAPAAREIQEGEIISPAANAEKAAKFTEQIEAATATPTKQATVAGQLEGLMQQFEGGNTPPWAAGSMRNAMATLAARGLGASSMAGQAVIQAAMEAALPIAQVDASTQAQFEAQNLSNRQQRAMLAAQQRATFLGQEFDQAFQARVANASRVADIANMNFNAEQQVALENARAANTVNLNNLTNRQAMVMSEAAALSQLDMANLNNRQQAAVQNAQNFLQMDMTNLSNQQQTAMFKSQQNIQALLTDQAAENAAAQFNATSENQTNQFFASLTSQVSQFNATQQNAMDQFNVNSVNALREFNSEIQQQRDLFNAQNGLVVAQANAQWRQNIATLNTAALNQSNADFARTINQLTQVNMEQIWQRERDIMSFAFQTANNNADRATSIAVENLRTEATKEAAEGQKSAGFAKAAGAVIGAIITG